MFAYIREMSAAAYVILVGATVECAREFLDERRRERRRERRQQG
jgi:heme exporter protein D